MTEWNTDINVAPYQEILEVINEVMEKSGSKPILATRGYVSNGMVNPDGTLFTTIYTPDAMFPIPAGRLCCPTKWRYPPHPRNEEIDMTSIENNYPVQGYYFHIDSYKEPNDIEEWLSCPKCNLKPHTWVFDNGELTACGCWNTKYDHFSVQADETIAQVIRRTGGFAEYDRNALRKKWNQYCQATDTKEKA